jgi:putative copper export protein
MTLASSRHEVLQRTINLRSLRRKRVALFVAAAAVTALATLAVALWLGGDLTPSNIRGLEIGGTGGFTSWGLAVSKMVLDLSSTGVIGMLLSCLLLPEHNRKPSPTARRCLRTASLLSLAWVISSAALLIFTWSDITTAPVVSLPITKLFTDTAGTFPGVAYYVSGTAVALMIAAGVAVTETRWGTMVLLLLAVYNLVPMALQGHASHGTILLFSLTLHVMAVSLWVGGLAALLIHVRREPALLAVAIPRFSTLALGCYIVIAATGIVASWQLLLSLPLLWENRYGVLLMLKGVALVTLGIFGWWHRQRLVRRIRSQDARAHRAFTRLAAAEVFVMVLTFALAVALSRTAAPDTILLHNS